MDALVTLKAVIAFHVGDRVLRLGTDLIITALLPW